MSAHTGNRMGACLANQHHGKPCAPCKGCQAIRENLTARKRGLKRALHDLGASSAQLRIQTKRFEHVLDRFAVELQRMGG